MTSAESHLSQERELSWQVLRDGGEPSVQQTNLAATGADVKAERADSPGTENDPSSGRGMLRRKCVEINNMFPEALSKNLVPVIKHATI
jgi:hypothetical protein